MNVYAFQKLCQSILLLIIIVLIVWNAYVWTRPSPDLTQVMQSWQQDQSVDQSLSPFQWPDVKPYDFYERVIAERNVFDKIKKPEEMASEEIVVDETAQRSLPEHLKIVGIVQGNPSEVVIEDSTASKTFFLEEGKKIDTFLLKKVMTNQVVLFYQGQAYHLEIN